MYYINWRQNGYNVDMASNIYSQYTADGHSGLMRRSTPQGRTAQPETRMIRTNITTSRAAKKIIKQKADALNMSFSAYLELAGILYTPELQKR
jgi:hypothetical protein